MCLFYVDHDITVVLIYRMSENNLITAVDIEVGLTLNFYEY